MEYMLTPHDFYEDVKDLGWRTGLFYKVNIV